MSLSVRSGDPVFDALPSACEEWFAQNKTLIDASPSLMQRAHDVVYFRDIRAPLEPFLAAPLPDGALFSSVSPLGEKQPLNPLFFDDEIRQLRFERDAFASDNESRAILMAHRVWQSSGDEAWLRGVVPILRRALENSFSHPHRWSTDLELPRRAFTLDGWPVPYKSTVEIDRTLRGDVAWCVHPGDAGFLFQACLAFALMCEAIGETAELWRTRAAHLEAQLNAVGWNGNFYTHQIHLAPVRVRGVDETRQLAACNAHLMNSGLASREQCASILKEYARRRELFAHDGLGCWSIHPPFPSPAFGIEPGVGPNGGMSVEVGGALALAAFESGQESVGIDVLRRFYDSAVKPLHVFGFLDADGKPQRDYSRGAWAGESVAAAHSMLHALVAGVCGIHDKSHLFKDVVIAPRWTAARVANVEVEIAYAASGSYVTYRWNLEGGRLTLDWDSKAQHIQFRILLPVGNAPERVALNGRTQAYALALIEKSRYVELETDKKRGTIAITLK